MKRTHTGIGADPERFGARYRTDWAASSGQLTPTLAGRDAALSRRRAAGERESVPGKSKAAPARAPAAPEGRPDHPYLPLRPEREVKGEGDREREREGERGWAGGSREKRRGREKGWERFTIAANFSPAPSSYIRMILPLPLILCPSLFFRLALLSAVRSLGQPAFGIETGLIGCRRPCEMGHASTVPCG